MPLMICLYHNLFPCITITIREEFSVFHAPSEPHNQRMHSLLVDEYIEDRDSDGDMHLTVHELMGESHYTYQ